MELTKKELQEKAGINKRMIDYCIRLYLVKGADYKYVKNIKNADKVIFTESGIAKVLNRPNARKKPKDTTM